MPTLNIGGQKVSVGDDFLKLSPDEQNATVEEIAGTLKVAPAADAAPVTPVGVNDLVRSGATGVPVIGGALNKMNAATNAALAPFVEQFMEPGPDTLMQPGDGLVTGFGDRMRKSQEIQEGMDKKFSTEHPYVDTGAKVVGGVAGMLPAVLAAPKLFGAAGTLPQMVGYGAGSGAAVSAADAVVRDEPVLENAGIGAAVGAGAPLAAKAIGAVARSFRKAPPVEAQNTVKVGETEIPLWESQVSGNAAASGEEQAILAGGRGDRAQAIAKEVEALQAERVAAARDEIGAGLHPGGVTPNEAGDRVLSELSAAEQTRFNTEAQRTARVAAEQSRLRDELGDGVAAVDNPQAAAETIAADLAQNEQRRAAAEVARMAGADAEGVALRTRVGGGVEGAANPFEAAETLGAGVAARRDAAVTDRNARYAAVRDEPGAFDPSVPRGLSQDIRTRLNTGDDPIWVDPDTASVANSALRVLDETLGENSGLFRNAAAGGRRPVGPVAEAAAPPVAPAAPPSEAKQALDELLAQGINPARAKQAVAGMDGADSLPRGPLEPHSVALPGGGSVEVRPRVVEADALLTSADAGYDQGLQPRNRARAASSAQVDDISRNLNPERLGISSEADRGAPIIGADGMVESGNGRTLALRKAYEENGEAAAKYREWLRSQGVDVSRFKNPVLVRERVTPMTPDERKAFTVQANQSSTLSMSAPERALADAQAITPDSLGLIRNPADLGAAENRDFVRSFMQQVPAAERGALMTANGDLSSEGLARVRNAVLGKAYGDTPVLARIAESTNDEVKSISNALVAAAPEWASLKAAIAAGRVPAELDVTEHLLDAVSRAAKIRGRGASLADDLAQADAFAKPSAESDQFLRMFYDADGRRAASSAKVSDALRFYAQEAAKVDAGPGLFGLKPVTAGEILETTAGKVGAPKELAKEVTEAAAARAAASEAGPEIGLREMDAARKRLVRMYTDARAAARASGNQSDVRAMSRIMHEFDNSIIDAFESGRFSGDSANAQRLLQEARASHAAYRETFTSRGGGDEIGRKVEKILGRYADSAATPDEIAKLSYGSLDKPGGGAATKVALRLRDIVGDTSPEWGAYKQGLIDMVEGRGRGLSPTKRAERIEEFLTGTQGRIMAQSVLSAEERAGLQSYARNLRSAEPVPLSALDSTEKVMARISGRDGGLPTPGEVADYLYGKSGETAVSIKVAQRIKSEFGADSKQWGAYKQGLFQKLTGEGASPVKTAEGIEKFLENRGLAHVAFSPAERAKIAAHAEALRAAEPRGIPAGDAVERVIARLSGRDGGAPATANEFVDQLMSRSGAANKEISAKLAVRLKQDLSPEGWDMVRGAFWKKLTDAGEGKIEFGAQKLAQRLGEFLNESGESMAKTLYSEAERKQMAELARVYSRMVPVKGTTNPSGTAGLLARIASKASSNVLAMLGAASSGFGGLAVGWAGDKAVRALANRSGAREATRLFYGQQPGKPPASTSKIPIVLGQGVAPQAGQR